MQVRFIGELPISYEQTLEQAAQNRLRGLPSFRELKPTSPPRLAVIGGGPSIIEHEDEIRAFDGERWAINGASQWCQERGIDAVFLSADPHDSVAPCAKGARRAILPTRIHPDVLDVLGDADVHVFEMDPPNVKCGMSTATAVPHLAGQIGFRHITFFGCESSYQPRSTHAYRHEERDEAMIVRCGDEVFMTAPDFYAQAFELSSMIMFMPEFLFERSGGFLRAMIKNNKEHDIIIITQQLADKLQGQI